MKFWNRLRLIGNLVLLAIAALTLVMALLHESDAPADTRSGPPRTPLQGGTSGL